MAKKPNLAAALAANSDDTERQAPSASAAPTPTPAANKRQSSRVGQVNISGWFDAPVKHALDELRLARQKELGRRVTLQEITAEAFNDLFKKYGMAEVAPSKEQ